VTAGVEVPLEQKMLAIKRAFEGSGTPYAFGGALALAYYAEPRVTVDVDVNIFMAPDEIDRVAELLEPLGVEAPPPDRRLARRDGQVRLRWGITPIDLFFAYDEFHFHAADRTRRVPFGDTTIPILAPEDLLVCKVVFDRRKDWIDIDQMLLLTAGTLDLADVRRWLRRIVGNDDERVAHFEAAVTAVLGEGYSA
jgi:nucleotidyltransferase AbiEii toxin of type IV toxin-antitoxin system